MKYIKIILLSCVGFALLGALFFRVKEEGKRISASQEKDARDSASLVAAEQANTANALRLAYEEKRAKEQAMKSARRSLLLKQLPALKIALENSGGGLSSYHSKNTIREEWKSAEGGNPLRIELSQLEGTRKHLQFLEGFFALEVFEHDAILELDEMEGETIFRRRYWIRTDRESGDHERDAGTDTEALIEDDGDLQNIDEMPRSYRPLRKSAALIQIIAEQRYLKSWYDEEIERYRFLSENVGGDRFPVSAGRLLLAEVPFRFSSSAFSHLQLQSDESAKEPSLCLTAKLGSLSEREELKRVEKAAIVLLNARGVGECFAQLNTVEVSIELKERTPLVESVGAEFLFEWYRPYREYSFRISGDCELSQISAARFEDKGVAEELLSHGLLRGTSTKKTKTGRMLRPQLPKE